MAAKNSEGHNLFMLVIMHLETDIVQKFISTFDLASCIDQKDNEGNNALLLAASSEQWLVLTNILSNNKLEEFAIDIHPKNKEDYTTLVVVLAAHVKVTKQIQNYKMKNDTLNERKMEAEAECLWNIVKLLLEKERDIHGSSPTSGKEAGIESLKKQMDSHKQIKSPLPEEVIDEFSKLYMVKIKTKKKPEPVPELPKEEPKKVLAVSSFQEQMNAIYQQQMESEKKRNIQKTTETNGVPAPSKNELPKSILKPEAKPTPKIEEPPKSILKSEPKVLPKVEQPKKAPPKSILNPELNPTPKTEEVKPILNTENTETKST